MCCEHSRTIVYHNRVHYTSSLVNMYGHYTAINIINHCVSHVFGHVVV